MYWDASDRRNERSNAIARATFFEQSGKAGYRVGPTHKPTKFRSRRTVNIHIRIRSDGDSDLGAAGGGSVVQYSDSWILMLLMYSRQSPNFSITSIVAHERLKVKMFDQRQVESSVK